MGKFMFQDPMVRSIGAVPRLPDKDLRPHDTSSSPCYNRNGKTVAGSGHMTRRATPVRAIIPGAESQALSRRRTRAPRLTQGWWPCDQNPPTASRASCEESEGWREQTHAAYGPTLWC